MGRGAGLLILFGVVVSACGSTVVVYAHAGTGLFLGGDAFDEPEPAIAIDYRGSGSCRGLSFDLVGLEPVGSSEDPIRISTPIVTSAAPDVSGTWVLAVRPGPYRLRGGTAGCAWSVVVRYIPPEQPEPGR